ncbi:MAG: phenylalanine--tRNA ligase subunit beta [Planctomycetota bacterium]
MPHITFPLRDLAELAGEPELTLERVGELCQLVKGELKLRHSSEDELKVELQDTNRPDTWTVEGIARHVRQRRTGAAGDYAFFADDREPAGAIEVDESVSGVRPYVSGFVARGWTVTEEGLQAFISAQEVLCRNFGRNRKSVAIGIYDASAIAFPIRYEATDAASGERAFVPLRPADWETVRDAAGEPIPAARWERRWTPAEILRDHPTGRTYADALPDPSRAPILVDAQGRVLSFPPLINSDDLGRVRPGMHQLFVETTGTVLDQVLLATNILAANLADRGAEIVPVLTRYPQETPRGRELRGPHPLEDRREVTVPAAAFGELLGEPDLARPEVLEHLRRFGLSVREQGEALVVSTLPYRADYLHAVDAIEDFAVSRGYQSFQPLLPEEFTIGALSAATAFGDLVRDRMIGVGFEEAIGNILTAVEPLRARCGLAEEGEDHRPLSAPRLVRIRNVMNRNYSVVRDWLLPTLLEVEAHSSGATYPHRVFETGEVCSWEPGANLASRTRLHLGALVADHQMGFSETQAYLHALLSTLGLPFGAEGEAGYRLVLAEHPSFIPGRAAWVEVRCAGRSDRVGLLGEVHPAVLSEWGIYFPTGAFELDLSKLEAVLEG